MEPFRYELETHRSFLVLEACEKARATCALHLFDLIYDALLPCVPQCVVVNATSPSSSPLHQVFQQCRGPVTYRSEFISPYESGPTIIVLNIEKIITAVSLGQEEWFKTMRKGAIFFILVSDERLITGTTKTILHAFTDCIVAKNIQCLRPMPVPLKAASASSPSEWMVCHRHTYFYLPSKTSSSSNEESKTHTVQDPSTSEWTRLETQVTTLVRCHQDLLRSRDEIREKRNRLLQDEARFKKASASFEHDVTSTLLQLDAVPRSAQRKDLVKMLDSLTLH